MKIPFTLLFVIIGFSMSFAQWSTAEMPEGRVQIGGASSGSKIFIAGGFYELGYSSQVLVYDTEEESWSDLSLSEGRVKIACAATTDNLICAGGIAFEGPINFATAEVFDLNTGQLTPAQLSQARTEISAVAVGNKMLFAGGLEIVSLGTPGDPVPMNAHAVVDIYDTQTNTWTTAQLSEARGGMAHAVVGNKALFAGGYKANGQVSDVVDIYDADTDTWSTATLPLARAFYGGGTGAAGKAYFAGGIMPGDLLTKRIDIYDVSTGTWTLDSLSQPRMSLQAATLDDKVFFAGGATGALLEGWISYAFSDTVDIYNLTNHTWSIYRMPNQRVNHVCLSAGNRIFVAGGYDSNFNLLTAMDVYTNEPTGIKPQKQIPAPRIYPNPVSGRLTVQFDQHPPDGVRMFLTDAAGQMVTAFSSPTGAAFEYRADQLPAGLYFLHAQSEEGTGCWKVVKR